MQCKVNANQDENCDIFRTLKLRVGFLSLRRGSLSLCASLQAKAGGRGGIRTHGGLPHARFRVECLKPDSATLPFLQDRHPADRFRKERVYYEASTTICKSAPSVGTVARTGRS